MSKASTSEEKPPRTNGNTRGCLIWGLLILWALGIIAIVPWINRLPVQYTLTFPNDYIIELQIPFLHFPVIPINLPPELVLGFRQPLTNFEAILYSIIVSTVFGIIFYVLYRIRMITPFLVWASIILIAGLLIVIIIWTVYNWLRAPLLAYPSNITLF